jgi:hypothetical protein
MTHDCPRRVAAATGYHVPMKWVVVALILGYVGLRVYIYFKPSAPISRAFRRRFILRTDAHAMTRKEMALSSVSFLVFAACAVGLYLGVRLGSAELGWRLFDSRPVVVLGKAGLFVGAMATAAAIFLAGAAVVGKRDP